MSGVRRNISAPSTVWRFMIANSASVSLSGLLSTSSRVGEAFFDALFYLNPAKTNVREDRQLRRPVFTDPSRFDRGQRLHQGGDFFSRHAQIDGHALDAGELQAFHELAEQFDLSDRYV